MVTSRLHFWILLSGSLFVAILLVIQAALLYAVQQQGRILVANREVASMGQTYETQWKQLAARTYELSRHDAALTDVLTRQQITVRTNPTPGSATESAPAPAPAPPPAPPKPTPQPPPPTPPKPVQATPVATPAKRVQ